MDTLLPPLTRGMSIPITQNITLLLSWRTLTAWKRVFSPVKDCNRTYSKTLPPLCSMSSHSKIHLLRSEKISQCLLDAGRTPRETHHVKSPQAGIAAAVARPHPSPTPAQRQRPAPAGEFQLEKAIISVGGPKTRRIMWLMWSMCG